MRINLWPSKVLSFNSDICRDDKGDFTTLEVELTNTLGNNFNWIDFLSNHYREKFFSFNSVRDNWGFGLLPVLF